MKRDRQAMENGEKLLKDTILYGIANFSSSILVFLMIPLYTYYFTTSEYGLWDLVVTTSTLLTPFITFELVAAVYRWLIEEKDEGKRKKIITTGFFVILQNLLIFNILGLIAINLISIPFGWQALLFINVSITSSFIQQCARGLGYNKLFASLGIIQTAITVTFNLFFIFALELRIEAFFYSSIIAALFVAFFAAKIMAFSKYIAPSAFSSKITKSFLAYSIPIIPGAASWWIMTMSDRYFITAFLGIEYNGIYAVANKIPALLLMINSVFFLAWKDSAILEFETRNKDHYYSKVFQHFFRLMATSVIILTLITKPVLWLVISGDFYESWKYIGILLFAALCNACALFWSAGYHGAKKTKVIFVTSFVGALVNVIVNLILIKSIGLYAVVISTALAFATVWLIRVFSSQRYFKITINYQDMVVLLFLIILANIAPFVFEPIGLLISICFGGVVFIAYNLNLIALIYRRLKLLFEGGR